jgi:asparagine synthase (glutamine-hydrolysing)
LLDWLSRRAPGARILDDASLSRFVALHADLPAYNLSSLGDRIEMAHGLEARLPFLDRAVVDLLWRMPVGFHQENGATKRVLRALLARRLPATAEKPKRAFLTPAATTSDLLRSPLARRWLSIEATRRAGIFEPVAVAAAQRLAAPLRSMPAARFYLGAYLTMALSTHLIIDMFGERFQATLAAHAPISLDALRRRLSGRPGPLDDAA